MLIKCFLAHVILNVNLMEGFIHEDDISNYY